MNPPQQRGDHKDPGHVDNVRPIGLGAELRAARMEGDPLARDLADVDGGAGAAELADAYGELAQLSAARSRVLRDGRHGWSPVDAFCGSRRQPLNADRGIVLGMCGHWWQPRVVADAPVRGVLAWGEDDCPHCGRPPGAYIIPGYEYEPERLGEIQLIGENTGDD